MILFLILSLPMLIFLLFNLLNKFYKLLGYSYEIEYADDKLPSLVNFQK